MSGDEVFVTLVSLVLGPASWIFWFIRATTITGFPVANRTLINSLIGILLVCSLLVQQVLQWGAADDVRDAPQYLFMYLVMGQAWMFVAAWAFQFAGLHSRDDLLERRNAAALPAWAGALIAVSLCFAGANVGNGPGWWVVVFSASLATAVLALVWIALGQSSGLVDAAIIDRDPAAGWRLGGALVAVGLICGVAVTGDWVSAPLTIVDFVARGWPVVPLAIGVGLVERFLRPTVQRPRSAILSAGIAPAALYVGLAVFAVMSEWRWS